MKFYRLYRPYQEKVYNIKKRGKNTEQEQKKKNAQNDLNLNNKTISTATETFRCYIEKKINSVFLMNTGLKE